MDASCGASGCTHYVRYGAPRIVASQSFGSSVGWCHSRCGSASQPGTIVQRESVGHRADLSEQGLAVPHPLEWNENLDEQSIAARTPEPRS
jgi:hypothetical protein